MDVWVFISLEMNTYPRRIRHSSNLGHIFREKGVSYRPGNTVCILRFTMVLYFSVTVLEEPAGFMCLEYTILIVKTRITSVEFEKCFCVCGSW
jgi:hypothetical protein